MICRSISDKGDCIPYLGRSGFITISAMHPDLERVERYVSGYAFTNPAETSVCVHIEVQ